MTTSDFLILFKKNVEADIGEGELKPSDIEHLKAIFDDTRNQAAQDNLPR